MTIWAPLKHYSFQNAAVRLAGYEAASEFLAPILQGRGKEVLIIAFCDDDLRLLGLLQFCGSSKRVRLPIASVLRRAVTANATGIILAHNHPSGEQLPSASDGEVTALFSKAALAVDITLVDHLIFNGGPAFSFRRASLI